MGAPVAPDQAAEAAAIGSLRVHESSYRLEWMDEPFGLSVLEAAQAGCALVLSRLPSLEELWSGAAVLVPPGDDDALAAALLGLIRDPLGRAAAAERARRRAAKLGPNPMVTGYLALYRELLDRRGVRRAAGGVAP